MKKILQQPAPSAASSCIVANAKDELILCEEMVFQLQPMGFQIDAFENAAQWYQPFLNKRGLGYMFSRAT